MGAIDVGHPSRPTRHVGGRIELASGERLVCENDSCVAVVPFWATWPFETLLLSRRHLTGMDELTAAERRGLADILKNITTRYDDLFDAPFPYTMGFHQRPTDGSAYPHVHFHGHFYPPLLRSATVRKFMVGFEMLGTPQRDLTPEAAAKRLRSHRTGRTSIYGQSENELPL